MANDDGQDYNGPTLNGAGTIQEPDELRFAFGENWRSFLRHLDDLKIQEAQRSLCELLGETSLAGKRFLDIGSGSGLHSLCARRLGASVHSFDFDADSVACTQQVRQRYFPEDGKWQVERGSILDPDYVNALGRYDICYAWGVLHHTGSLWKAIDHSTKLVDANGLLVLAIYNDQGIISDLWRCVKRGYCSSKAAKFLLTGVFFTGFAACGLAIDVLHLRNPRQRYTEHRRHRGMSLIHDWRDWLGGYPFEPASTQRVIDFCGQRGYVLRRLMPCIHGFTNNQFVFQRGN